MAFGIFLHRSDSKYNDLPSQYYQFPKSYLSRAAPFAGSWIIYYEPTKVKNTRGYYAVAKVEKIIPDPSVTDRFLALIEAGSYLEFPSYVPFVEDGQLNELGLLNEEGKISGRSQSAVRPISISDFNRILDKGLNADIGILPRVDSDFITTEFTEKPQSFDFGHEVGSVVRDMSVFTSNRAIRDPAFRRAVISAYDERCAITGLKLINGGGRAEVQAGHIRPVAAQGPDAVQNGLALSGTVHWMFDRGLISLSDSMEILISRHVNDRDSIESLIYPTGYARPPEDKRLLPHPSYLGWHREHCFKQ